MYFDDPLSALDVHVASALFKEGICGSILKEKTRIISLNSHYHLLKDADYIIVMEDGSIASQGNYYEVSKTPLFKHLMSSMEQDQQNGSHMEANGDPSSDLSRVAIPSMEINRRRCGDRDERGLGSCSKPGIKCKPG